MLHRVKLDNNATLILCSNHRKIAGDHIVEDEGREQGGKWRCRVCAMERKMAGGLIEPVSTLCGRYVVTAFPTGAVYCECPAWHWGKAPVEQRTCKHTAAVNAELIELARQAGARNV